MSALEEITRMMAVSRSYSGDASLTTTYADDYILRGYGHQICRVLSVLTTGTHKLVLDGSAMALNTALIILPLSMGGTGGPVLVKTYPVTSYSGGNVIPCACLNGLKQYPAAAVVKEGITSSDTPGEQLREYIFGSTGNPQQVARGGSGGGSMPLVLPARTMVCLEIDNQYTDTIQFGVNMVWFEIGIG